MMKSFTSKLFKTVPALNFDQNKDDNMVTAMGYVRFN